MEADRREQPPAVGRVRRHQARTPVPDHEGGQPRLLDFAIDLGTPGDPQPQLWRPCKRGAPFAVLSTPSSRMRVGWRRCQPRYHHGTCSGHSSVAGRAPNHPDVAVPEQSLTACSARVPPRPARLQEGGAARGLAHALRRHVQGADHHRMATATAVRQPPRGSEADVSPPAGRDWCEIRCAINAQARQGNPGLESVDGREGASLRSCAAGRPYRCGQDDCRAAADGSDCVNDGPPCAPWRSAVRDRARRSRNQTASESSSGAPESQWSQQRIALRPALCERTKTRR